jgi:putative oxidoreductase
MKKLFSTKYSAFSFSLATLLLRGVLGGLMIPHGFNKLMHFGQQSATFSDPFYVGHAVSMAFVIFAEFFCAVLIVLGLLTRLACIPLIIVMAVAVFHANHGHIFKEGETATLYLAGFLTLLFIGPGKASIDRLIGK